MKKQLFSLEKTTVQSEVIACKEMRGGGQEKNNQKNCRAEEEERHKGSLIQKRFTLLNCKFRACRLQILKSIYEPASGKRTAAT
jgi:hypothetical protein